MNIDRPLNGSDYLMLGFDHELRRRGFVGNTCQIVLNLGAAPSCEMLEKRVAAVAGQCPIVNARPGGRWQPRWKLPANIRPPRVRTHAADDSLGRRLFNEPLDVRRGELARFDLAPSADGRATLTFSWAHALMDAPGAEYFLALIGHQDLSLPAGNPASTSRPKARLLERCRVARKSLHHLDRLCQPPPRSPGTRHPSAPAELRFRVERFSAGETARARANSARLCGLLGDTRFHAAATICELHQLHQRLGCASPSYAIPVPVGLRPKGSIDPIFSNEVSMLMFQFLPEDLGSTAAAAAAFRKQMEQAMRDGLLESGRALGELFRFLPLGVYVKLLKHGLRGEICSLFFGDTAAVHPRLSTFLGVPVEDFTHVAAVTPSPGLGVICYTFGAQLRVTIVYSARVLDDTEAGEFASQLRARLLEP